MKTEEVQQWQRVNSRLPIPGDTVYVIPLKFRGIVISVDDTKCVVKVEEDEFGVSLSNVLIVP